MGKYTLKCKMCGKHFEHYNETALFCSRDCYREYIQQTKKCKDIVCCICQTRFRQKRPEQVFCSVECRAKSTENKRECQCEYCGELFLRKESEVLKNNRHYCSDDCRMKAISWKQEDVNLLIKNFNTMSYKEMTDIFSFPKTIDEIKRKAIYIGLTSSRHWTGEEIEILVKNYSIKPMREIMKLLPNRTRTAILGQARTQNLKSFFYLNHLYSQEEDGYLKQHYLEETNQELGKKLNRSPHSIGQRLRVLGLHRPLEICNYQNLYDYTRQRLVPWRNGVREKNDYTCEITGVRSNIVVHHIRGFNLLFDEAIEMLEFPLYENMSMYNQIQLDEFLDTFLNLQEYYKQYICINEEIHKKFHSIYGYGNNTQEQWDEFINKYYK